MGHAFRKDYMDRMKRRYAKARTRAQKSALIDETVAMCSLSRKFVIRLLNGSYRYRPHRGRAGIQENPRPPLAGDGPDVPALSPRRHGRGHSGLL